MSPRDHSRGHPPDSLSRSNRDGREPRHLERALARAAVGRPIRMGKSGILLDRACCIVERGVTPPGRAPSSTLRRRKPAPELAFVRDRWAVKTASVDCGSVRLESRAGPIGTSRSRCRPLAGDNRGADPRRRAALWRPLHPSHPAGAHPASPRTNVRAANEASTAVQDEHKSPSRSPRLGPHSFRRIDLDLVAGFAPRRAGTSGSPARHRELEIRSSSATLRPRSRRSTAADLPTRRRLRRRRRAVQRRVVCSGATKDPLGLAAWS